MYFNLLLTSTIIFSSINGFQTDPIKSPIVSKHNEKGNITGILKKGYRVQEYYEAFLGIPYAEPPINELRFADPVAIDDVWSRKLLATAEKDECVQQNVLVEGAPISGSEDCLYLNVYRPRQYFFKKNKNSLLPVMVYIHGGGFFSGSPGALFHGADYFMDNGNVILVTLAYRLGPFGFLSTGDSAMPGNFGLKDQSLALRWVKENIIHFNGNPDSITIFGQSAGGASVHFHILSPMSKNLFNKAIIMSGSAIAPYTYPIENPFEQARHLAKEIGINKHDEISTEELTSEMRKICVKKILDAGHIFKFFSVDPLITYRVVIESKNQTNPFITEDPRLISRDGPLNSVPLLMSIVPFDGAVRTPAITSNPATLAELNQNFVNVLGQQMEFPSANEDEFYNKTDQIIQRYFNGETQINSDNEHKYLELFGDRAFRTPFYLTYKKYSKLAHSELYPVYLIKFAFKGPYSYSSIFTGTNKDYGVVHCDDLLYLFKTGIFPKFNEYSVEADMITALVKIYVDFATYGMPYKQARNCEYDETDPEKPCEYLEITRSENGRSISYRLKTDQNLDMIRFWKAIDPSV